jgi:Zn-dependent protease
MLKSEYRIGHVWGIPIKIHVSLLVLLVYLAARGAIGGIRSAGIMGGMLSVLFILFLELLVFTSIALHELGHSFVAIRKGCRVREITLMFIGGAAKMEQIPTRPLDEFLMAIAGPVVSLLLGIAGMTAAVLLHQTNGILAYLRIVIFYAGLVNLILAGFNLIPAFPMDGGRVFRALMTPRHGRLKATYLASRLGRIVAICFFIIGLFGLKGIPIFEAGNPFLMLIAVFIFITADREYRMVQFEELMKRRGFGSAWPGMTQEPEQDDETVLISPPPYAKGPDAKTELHHGNDRESPFTRLFRR